MKLRLLGLLGWLAFCFVFLLYIKLLLAGSFAQFAFHQDAPWWMFLQCLIGAGLIIFAKWKFDLLSEESTSANRDFLFLVSLIPFITLAATVWIIVVVEKIMFGKTDHTYYDWVISYLYNFIVLTMVCFSCISYFYLSALEKARERLLESERLQAETQLKLLHQQVNPHFLFNNLNVLSSLVQKKPKIASEFLEKMAALYRYILQTRANEIVPLEEELEFSRNYLFLLEKRFGSAYSFDWRIPKASVKGQMVIPASLQCLLENVVKHNSGDPDAPLSVRIELTDESLIVENERRARSQTQPSSNLGLQNLCDRYALLTDDLVEIFSDEGMFRVALPLLRLQI